MYGKGIFCNTFTGMTDHGHKLKVSKQARNLSSKICTATHKHQKFKVWLTMLELKAFSIYNKHDNRLACVFSKWR
jgi:hypothetical protein